MPVMAPLLGLKVQSALGAILLRGAWFKNVAFFGELLRRIRVLNETVFNLGILLAEEWLSMVLACFDIDLDSFLLNHDSTDKFWVTFMRAEVRIDTFPIL